jgi:hypothetical protein
MKNHNVIPVDLSDEALAKLEAGIRVFGLGLNPMCSLLYALCQ